MAVAKIIFSNTLAQYCQSPAIMFIRARSDFPAADAFGQLYDRLELGLCERDFLRAAEPVAFGVGQLKRIHECLDDKRFRHDELVQEHDRLGGRVELDGEEICKCEKLIYCFIK